MKTLFFISFILAVVTMSCTKSTLIPPDAGASTSPKTTISTFPKQQSRLLFNLLNGEEKYNEWTVHLKNGMQQLTLTPVQRQFIESLLLEMNITWFAQPVRAIESRIQHIDAMALIMFANNKNQYLYLFHYLQYSTYNDFLANLQKEQGAPDDDITAGGDATECTCSKKMDGCVGTTTCQAEVSCKRTEKGCGLFWLYDCTSKCTTMTVQQ